MSFLFYPDYECPELPDARALTPEEIEALADDGDLDTGFLALITR